MSNRKLLGENIKIKKITYSPILVHIAGYREPCAGVWPQPGLGAPAGCPARHPGSFVDPVYFLPGSLQIQSIFCLSDPCGSSQFFLHRSLPFLSGSIPFTRILGPGLPQGSGLFSPNPIKMDPDPVQLRFRPKSRKPLIFLVLSLFYKEYSKLTTVQQQTSRIHNTAYRRPPQTQRPPEPTRDNIKIKTHFTRKSNFGGL